LHASHLLNPSHPLHLLHPSHLLHPLHLLALSFTCRVIAKLVELRFLARHAAVREMPHLPGGATM
jgi:hypothetical protein